MLRGEWTQCPPTPVHPVDLSHLKGKEEHPQELLVNNTKGQRMHECVRESPPPGLITTPPSRTVSSPARSRAPQAPHRTPKREEGRSARMGESCSRQALGLGELQRGPPRPFPGGGPAQHPTWPSGGAGGSSQTAGLQPEGRLSRKPPTLSRSNKALKECEAQQEILGKLSEPREEIKLEVDRKFYIRQSASLCPWKVFPYHTFLQPSNARELCLSLVKSEKKANITRYLFFIQILSRPSQGT